MLPNRPSISRRTFLEIMATASTASVTPRVASAAPTTTVLVIGAGYAGLSAARMLVDAGVNAIVLEARTGIGGRAWTAFEAQLPALRTQLGPGASVEAGIQQYLLGTGLLGDDRRVLESELRLLVELDYAGPTEEELLDALGLDPFFPGSHVIMTVPLAVLKAGSISFSPTLPTAKQQAITNLGVGSLEKVVLRFPSIFWTTITPNSTERSRPRSLGGFDLSRDDLGGALPALDPDPVGGPGRLDGVGRTDRVAGRRVAMPPIGRPKLDRGGSHGSTWSGARPGSA